MTNSRSSTDLLLLLVLQKLLLLVVVELLELLELVVLLQGEMSLMLLKVTAYRPLVPLTGCAPCSAAATCSKHKNAFIAELRDTAVRKKGSVLTSSHDVGPCGG